jgi:hypothetical protein
VDFVLIHVGIAAGRVEVLVAGGLLGDRQIAPGGVHHVGDEVVPQIVGGDLHRRHPPQPQLLVIFPQGGLEMSGQSAQCAGVPQADDVLGGLGVVAGEEGQRADLLSAQLVQRVAQGQVLVDRRQGLGAEGKVPQLVAFAQHRRLPGIPIDRAAVELQGLFIDPGARVGHQQDQGPVPVVGQPLPLREFLIRHRLPVQRAGVFEDQVHGMDIDIDGVRGPHPFRPLFSNNCSEFVGIDLDLIDVQVDVDQVLHHGGDIVLLGSRGQGTAFVPQPADVLDHPGDEGMIEWGGGVLRRDAQYVLKKMLEVSQAGLVGGGGGRVALGIEEVFDGRLDRRGRGCVGHVSQYTIVYAA